ncbi:MAG: cupin domain-containing protein [Methylomonas sp.]|jgi:quercetin dioxygenase-like cupin family protein
MKKRSILLVFVIALSLDAHPAFSLEISESKQPEVSREIIQSTAIEGGDEEPRLILVEFPPEYASPAHVHPVVGLNYIIEGVAESQYEDEAVTTLHAGDSYQDPANKKHLVFRNPSKTEALRFIIACKIKKGASFMEPL